MPDDKDTLSYEEAVAFLPEGDAVHTFRGAEIGLPIGADWDREKLLAAMKKHAPLSITGPMAQAMKHGMGFRDERGWVFVETIRRTDETEAAQAAG